jgi:hypothetical protein
MPLQRGALRREDFPPGDLPAPAIEPGTVHLELAAIRALHDGTDDDDVIRGERE